jgi:phage-related baseplate assembly protein
MPASPDNLSGLLVQQSQADIYNAFLSICTTIGLPVTSWQPGDPTRSLGFLEATDLETLESIVVGYIQSGFLDYASGIWLTIVAQQVFNVAVPQPTYATTAEILTNTSGYVYVIDPGDLTFSNSSSGATYTNTSGGTLNGVGATLSVTVVATQAGSGSSAGAGEIDTLVTTLLGVTCANPTAAIGLDLQAAATTVQQCRNKLSSLSPAGPAGAYSYVALTAALTGVTDVTRAREYDDSETGDVTLYIAGPSGAVSGSDVTAVQNAVNQYATPLCITPTVLSAANVVIPITYSLWIYSDVNQTAAQIEAAVETAIENFFVARPIGGDIIPPATSGALYASMIESVIGQVFAAQTFRVLVTLPAVETTPLTNGQVPALGTITPTINLISR